MAFVMSDGRLAKGGGSRKVGAIERWALELELELALELELELVLELELELELELIQAHMTQKPMLRVEVGARAVSVEREGMGERACAKRLGG